MGTYSKSLVAYAMIAFIEVQGSDGGWWQSGDSGDGNGVDSARWEWWKCGWSGMKNCTVDTLSGLMDLSVVNPTLDAV
jgi:hypothetical protein